MGRQLTDKRTVRSLTLLGGKSIGLTLPIGLVRALGWKEKQKVTVKKVKGGVVILDLKK
jgi:antitoxin component of MazEF toxin-antitoxin module